MSDPLIGKIMGNYQLERLLGEGGMGAVYLARHRTIGRQVAIKVLAPHIGAQPELAERFINEAKAGARITHPSVIDIFDFGKTDEGRLYCVTEHLVGRELADVMRERGPASGGALLPRRYRRCPRGGPRPGCRASRSQAGKYLRRRR